MTARTRNGIMRGSFFPTMKISIGSDHAGFELKELLAKHLRDGGYEISDKGAHSLDSVDYPDYAQDVANEVASGKADFGVLVCGTGIGMTIAANKVRGIRAANCTSDDYARLAREHNDANVACFGARFTSAENATKWLDTFLTTPFAAGRHTRRRDKLDCMKTPPEADKKEGGCFCK